MWVRPMCGAALPRKLALTVQATFVGSTTRTVPVNVYDLGLIYKIDVSDSGEVNIDMTLTAPNCPAADFIMEDVRQKVESVDGVSAATINLVFEPEWDKDMMSEEAKLELGFL